MTNFLEWDLQGCQQGNRQGNKLRGSSDGDFESDAEVFRRECDLLCEQFDTLKKKQRQKGFIYTRFYSMS
jgi:hypothetical protein